MKSIYRSMRLSHWRLLATCLISAALMTGCGSGSFTSAGASSGGTGILLASISGSVADGYLANATVFLDKNGNYQLDEGEPSGTTDTNGAYKLTIDPADLGKYPIVALVIKGVSIDKDTNLPVVNSYVLSMSKEGVSGTISNFISPITSQLREMMETGNYASTQQAAEVLRARMGLPGGNDLMADYIAANNTALHTAAQNMATLMGNQMGQVLGMNGSTITVDVNRYRGMMGAIFNNMSTVMETHNQNGMSNLNATVSTMMSNMPSTLPRNMSNAGN